MCAVCFRPALNAPCFPMVGLGTAFSPSEAHPLEAPLPNHPLEYIPDISPHPDVITGASDVIYAGDVMEVDNNCNQMGPPIGAPPLHGVKMELYNNGHAFPSEYSKCMCYFLDTILTPRIINMGRSKRWGSEQCCMALYVFKKGMG